MNEDIKSFFCLISFVALITLPVIHMWSHTEIKCREVWMANVNWGSDIYVGETLEEARARASGNILYNDKLCEEYFK